jgi:hypothetical protein
MKDITHHIKGISIVCLAYYPVGAGGSFPKYKMVRI